MYLLFVREMVLDVAMGWPKVLTSARRVGMFSRAAIHKCIRVTDSRR
jgi:hypothetical protein